MIKKKEQQGIEHEDFVIPQFVESWIQGYPLKTDYGYVKALKVKDWFKYINGVEVLKKQGWEVEDLILREVMGSDKESLVRQIFRKYTFMECLKNNLAGIRDVYSPIFREFVEDFNEKEFFMTINQDEFDNFRRLILDFNHVQYREANPNKEIERFNRMKEYLKKTKGGSIEFDTIFTTLMSGKGGGFTPDQINDMTYRQFMLNFKRVEFMIAHDTTALFKTVDTGNKVEIVNWSRSSREEIVEQVYDSLEDLQKSNVFAGGKANANGYEDMVPNKGYSK